MATPEVPQDVLDRLSKVEDAVQEFRFIHMVKVEATTNGLATLWAGQQRLQEEVSGLRAEVATEFGAFRGEVDTRLSAIESAVAEILRRLPER